MAVHETPSYHVVLAKKGDTILQATFCDSQKAAREIQEASERQGQFWYADHEVVAVPKPLTRSELAYMLVG